MLQQPTDSMEGNNNNNNNKEITFYQLKLYSHLHLLS